MFRIVQAPSRGLNATTGQPIPPYFWLVCDERKCGQHRQQDIPKLNDALLEQEASAAVDAFTREAAKDGWLLAVDGHFCPSCYRVMVERDRQRQEQLQRMQQEAEQMRQKERGERNPLVQINTDTSPAAIKQARLLEERRRKITKNLQEGNVPKAQLQ